MLPASLSPLPAISPPYHAQPPSPPMAHDILRNVPVKRRLQPGYGTREISKTSVQTPAPSYLSKAAAKRHHPLHLARAAPQRRNPHSQRLLTRASNPVLNHNAPKPQGREGATKRRAKNAAAAAEEAAQADEAKGARGEERRDERREGKRMGSESEAGPPERGGWS